MKRFLLPLLFILLGMPARADVTITNNVNGTAASLFDTNFNQIDAHEGQIIQQGTCPGAGCLFYKIGTAYDCGYQWNVSRNTPYCGVKIYTSPDLTNWTYVGYLFDATTSYWQNRCASNSTANGCFWPRLIFNPATNLWVFWVNQEGGGIVNAVQQELVMTCTTITGPCTSQADPTHLAHTPAGPGTLFIDDDGTCYFNYDNVSTFDEYVEKLTPDCLDSTGISVMTISGSPTPHEAPAMFKANGTYYSITAQTCAYCNTGVNTIYTSASSPLGTWSAPTTINSSNGCGTQPARVNTYVINGVTQYEYVGDRWYGQSNEGAANEYYQPLSFTGSAINSFSCNDTVTITGLTAGSAQSQNPAPDQTSLPAVFGMDGLNPTGVNSGFWHMQTFVPTKPTLISVRLQLAQYATGGVGAGTPLDGDLTVRLMTVDGSNNPVSTLATATVAHGSLSWAGKWITVPLSYSGLTPGATYAIVLSATPTNGVILDAQYFGSSGNPYPAGVNRYSTNSGATWTTLTGRAEMFSTIAPPDNVPGCCWWRP